MDKKKLKKFRKMAQQAKDRLTQKDIENIEKKTKNVMPKKKPIVSMTDDDSGVMYSVRGENVSKDDFMKSVEQQGKDEAAGAGGYSQGGEVRGTGSAVKGLGFKGVF
tara:strand:- start:153 stop:473 length:321 start_codon:yes stop_codon:yes gene_type:complete